MPVMRPPREKQRRLVRLASPLPRAELTEEHLREWQAWTETLTPLPEKTRQSQQHRAHAMQRPQTALPVLPVEPTPDPYRQPDARLADEQELWAAWCHREASTRRLDLHGMVLEDAYRAVRQFLERQQLMGVRQVWVITGKGTDGEGALRQDVPRWLRQWPELVRQVVEASHREGGAGALKVTLAQPPKMTRARGGKHA